ncbi:MAG: hypothetical protein IH940_05565 [Acidobacteria bacterium]|nr:hypothetical protein [Acidobacteriota bacterium]
MGSERLAPEAIGAFAVVRGEEPRIFLAENATVISRLLALELVANESPSTFSSQSQLVATRAALLEERWADALLLWISATGLAVDVYPETLTVWTEDDLDEEQAAFEIRMSPLFEETEDS